MIKINKLNKYFNKKHTNQIHVINDATIEFPSVGLVTILGESGSGKTTLLNVIGGLDSFDSGSIQVDEYLIKKYCASKIDRMRNEKIGYIFQNYLLLTDRTVYYNLELMLNMYKISNDEKKQRIEYTLKAVGMLKYKNKLVSELSGGQQQRIAIARALIKSPSVILADEPTGNLDEKNTLQIMNIIKKISEKVLVIMVSHEKSIASSYADQIITVSDGKVISITNNEKVSLYKYKDDYNIYLKEYNHNNYSNEYLNIDFYSNDTSQVNIKLIYDNGKYYITSNQEIVVVDDNNEIEIKDEYRKEIDVKEKVLLSEFQLKELEYKNTPRLSFQEIWKLALTNLRKVKKKNIFISLILFVMAALTLATIQSIIDSSKVDYRHLSYTDSRLYNIKVSSGEVGLTSEQLTQTFGNLYDKIRKEQPTLEIMPVSSYQLSSKLDFKITGYTQLQINEYSLEGYTLMPLSALDENKVIYGKMPTSGFEIVIDEWLALNLLENNSISNFMNVSTFVGQKLKLSSSEVEFTISGVARTNQNSAYLNEWALLAAYPAGLKKNSIKVCSITEYKKYDPTFSSVLQNNEIIISTLLPRQRQEWPYKVGDELTPNRDNLSLKIVEIKEFPTECPFNMIIADDGYEKLLRSTLLYNHEEFYIYIPNEQVKNQAREYMQNLAEEFNETSQYKIQIEHGSKYDELVKPAEKEAQKVVTSRTIITITIIIVTLIIIFFTMKSYAIKNIYTIGVYRAIGINKQSIIHVYLIQMLVMTLKTTLVSCTLCYIITNLITNFPNSNINFAIDLNTYLLTTSSLMLINLIIGILPISLYMKLTPSKLLSKYDI